MAVTATCFRRDPRRKSLFLSYARQPPSERTARRENSPLRLFEYPAEAEAHVSSISPAKSSLCDLLCGNNTRVAVVLPTAMLNFSKRTAYCALAVLIALLVCEPWLVAPRSTNLAPLGCHCTRISAKGTRQVVRPTLFRILAADHDSNLAVSAGVGSHCLRALFSCRGSDDACCWGRMRLRNRRWFSLENDRTAGGGMDCGRRLRRTPSVGFTD